VKHFCCIFTTAAHTGTLITRENMAMPVIKAVIKVGRVLFLSLLKQYWKMAMNLININIIFHAD